MVCLQCHDKQGQVLPAAGGTSVGKGWLLLNQQLLQLLGQSLQLLGCKPNTQKGGRL